MKREFRGIQIKAKSLFIPKHTVYYISDVLEMTVDCHLGSLIITKDELLDYLEQREKDKELK